MKVSNLQWIYHRGVRVTYSTRRNTLVFRLIIFCLLPAVLMLSCSEGIFNFNEETGNISIAFTADSSVTDQLSKVVFNLTNDETGASIRRESETYYGSSSTQQAECYISRADAGYWSLLISVYDGSDTIISELNADFELKLAQTVIADIEYYSDGSMSVNYEKPVGSDPVSLLEADGLDVLVTFFHVYDSSGAGQDETQIQTNLIVSGAGFDKSLESLRITFPDGGVFSYNGGWARAVGNIYIETSSTMLTATLLDYSSRGAYSMLLTDTNGTETSLSDYCDFGFDPYAPATLNGTYTNASANVISSSDYNKNQSGNAGTYIVYTVDSSDGTSIGGSAPTVFNDIASLADLTLNGYLASGLLVLCTVDAYLTQTDIDSVYDTTNPPDLYPDNLPFWLYEYFGDGLNYIGVSVQYF